MNEQFIAVLTAFVLEPALRWVKGKFALSGAPMLLVTGAFAALGAVIAVGVDVLQEGGAITLERVVELIPTVFAVGQLIFASLKIARSE